MAEAARGRACPGEGRTVVKKPRRSKTPPPNPLGPTPVAVPLGMDLRDVEPEVTARPTGHRFLGEVSGVDASGRYWTEGGWCGTRYREG